MSLANLKNIQANYDNTYFGQSDKKINKELLQNIVDVFVRINTENSELNEKVATLEEQMENRMLCKNYKEE